MHDTFLFQKITNEIFRLCQEYKLKRLTHVEVSVFEDSHINTDSLYRFLMDTNSPVVGEWTKIVVEPTNPEPLTAIVHQIQGDELENCL